MNYLYYKLLWYDNSLSAWEDSIDVEEVVLSVSTWEFW